MIKASGYILIIEDVPAEDFAAEHHADINGESHTRHGNMDQQARQDSEYGVFVDMLGDLLRYGKAVDGLPVPLFYGQGELVRRHDVPSDLLRQPLHDVVPHPLRVVEEKGNLKESPRRTILAGARISRSKV